MVKGPHGGFVVSDVGPIDRPGPDSPLVEFTRLDEYIETSNRDVVPLPPRAGGGSIDMAWRRRNARPPAAPSGGVYASLSPFDDVIDARLASDFFVSRRSSGAGVASFDELPPADERSYGWRVDRAIEDVVTGDFLTSDAPDRVESPDGQSGLSEFTGHLQPCGKGEVRSCSCCICPECGIRSIRYRIKGAESDEIPTYACNGQDCGAEFDMPTLRPARESGEPRGD